MTNNSSETWHYDATVIKRTVEGIVTASDYIDPGEELIDAAESRATQDTSS